MIRNMAAPFPSGFTSDAGSLSPADVFATSTAVAPSSLAVSPGLKSRVARSRRRLPLAPPLSQAGSSGQSSRSSALVCASRPREEGGQKVATPPCCRCKCQGKCKRCVCVKQGRVCINCFPNCVGGCHNLGVSASSPTHSPMSDPPSSASLPIPSYPPIPPPSTSFPIEPAPSSASLPIHFSPSIPPPSTSLTISALQSPACSSEPAHQPLDQASASSPPSLSQHLPSWDSIVALRCSTLHHVPKGARDDWADLLTGTLSTIVENPSNVDKWGKLFLWPRCVLTNPSRGDRLGWRELLTIVRQRIRRWHSGDVVGLWEEAVASVSAKPNRGSRSRRETKAEALQASNVRRAKLATQAGRYRKAIQALTSEGLAPPSESSLEEMLAKHPQSPPPPHPSTSSLPSISVPIRCVSRALQSFPADSAPGPTLLRANHLKEATRSPTASCGNRALKAITAIVNLLATGGAPPEIASYLCSANLLAVKKKNGGLRPIAVGEVLRRLTSKSLSRAVHSDAFAVLTPSQLGVGVKGGCEAVVHSVAHILDREDLPSLSRWILLIDFSNAFNSVSREHMFQEVRAFLPGLSSWVESCYSIEPHLLFGDHSLRSRCGVQQGDPLGPLGFAITLQPIVERIKREIPSLLCNTWYLDDGVLCGTPEDLVAALKIIEEEGPPRGLYLNRHKSLLYIPPGDDLVNNPLPQDIPITSSGFCLLGAPLGLRGFCESSALGRVAKIQSALGDCVTLKIPNCRLLY